MIRLKNVTKSYGDKAVLDGFSLEIACGEKISLMGDSGCGKTTLLRIISGLENADSGELEISESIAVMFQEHRLLPWISARENIRTVLDKNSLPLADKYLELVGLSDASDKLPSELSGGMAQRVSFARMLAYAEATDAELLLLDEPFSALDSELADRMLSLLLEFAKERTVIMVTHDRAEADALGGRIIQM